MMLTLLLSAASVALCLLVLRGQRRQLLALRQARANLQSMIDWQDALDARDAARSTANPEGPPNRTVKMRLSGFDIE
jgi:hypothetical protein